MRRILSLLTALSILLCCISASVISTGAAEKEIVLTAENVSEGDFNADSESDRQKLLDLEKSLPSKLDLRNYNGKNYVTPVKLQNPFGSCWAFAMTAAAEISYLYENDMGVPAGEVNDQVDFSEKYISWYMHHALTEDDVQMGAVPASQVGEGFDLSKVEKDNSNYAYDIAANPLYGVNFYASGFGPVDESTSVNGEYPYVYAGKNRWRGTDPDEVSEEFAKLRKEAAYREMQSYIEDLILLGDIESEDEFDTWFENNWKSGENNYAKSVNGNGYSILDDWTLPNNAEYRLPEIQAYFKSSYLLPSPSIKDDEGKYLFDRTGIAAIKSELSKGRGVSIGIVADHSRPNEKENDKGYMNTTNWAHYYNGVSRMNHLVTIVGYDDNYPKENFTRKVDGRVVEGSTPPENGAFIVKNSWGALTDEDKRTARIDEFGNTVYKSPNANGWGIDDTGYFYLSYYDHSYRTPTSFSFYDEDETEFYEMNYDQYDLMQDVKYYELKLEGETTEAANIFVAEEDEYLYQISAMVSKPMSKIKYKVYVDVKDTPDSGELVEQGEVSKQFAGYQRIDLSNMTYLPKGTRYSVIINQEVRDDKNAVYTPVSVGLTINYSSKEGTIINSVINEGESFVRFDGEWKDFAMLKNDVEDFFYKDCTKDYGMLYISITYPNLAGDFQVDNLPIKAFLVPARTVNEYVLGDADLDDDVTVADATLIRRFDCGMTDLSYTAAAASDADNDGDVTVIDATWIQRWELKMNAPEAIGKTFVIRAEDQ